eukprot:30666-Rhodomonas_salina.1
MILDVPSTELNAASSFSRARTTRRSRRSGLLPVRKIVVFTAAKLRHCRARSGEILDSSSSVQTAGAAARLKAERCRASTPHHAGAD